ncbi:MAG: RNA polymerase sigma factor [Snowella sp.]
MKTCLRHFSSSISVQSSGIQNSRFFLDSSPPGAIRPHQLDNFWQLWLSHRDYLYRCCLRWMGYKPMEAEDALSLAMWKAYRKFTQYANQIRQWKSWLTKLCYRVCLDLRRSIRSPLNLEELETEPPTPDYLSPYRYAIAQETQETINQAIQKLPKSLRQAFTLRCVEELSYPEIAQHLEITEANARKRVEQARAKLRKSLKSQFHEVM